MKLGQGVTLSQFGETITGSLDGFHHEAGGIVYEVWVGNDDSETPDSWGES